MISVSSLCAAQRRASAVDLEDIKRVYSLFVDVRRSTQFLMEYQKDFMFNTLTDQDEHADDSDEEVDDEDDEEEAFSESEDEEDKTHMQ